MLDKPKGSALSSIGLPQLSSRRGNFLKVSLGELDTDVGVGRLAEPEEAHTRDGKGLAT